MKEKWGILAGNTGFFKMDEVEVPAENLVGRQGEGFKIAMFALDQGRFTVAAGATGLIRACRDASVKYAHERKTFGVEIGQHQLVKEMIAQMESDYQAARLLWLRSGLDEERRAAQHARDRAGEVVRDGGVRARGGRRRPGPRRQRLLGRVSGRPLLSQLQGRGDLRRHARDSQADAGGLPARLSRPTGPRAASCRRMQPAANRLRHRLMSIHICRWSCCASSSRPPSPARTRWARAIATSPIRSPSRRCAR